MMQARLVPVIDLAAYDAQLLDDKGRMRLLPAVELNAINRNDELGSWCIQRARYGLVTKELVEFLHREVLRGSTSDALEIGAGMGDLGRHLGVRMTDAAIQTHPKVRAYYDVLQQAICDPPVDVERIDGRKAVRLYKPRIVIGSWVTQLYAEGDQQNQIPSSIFGVNEEDIVKSVEVYVHIGNDQTHAGKRILALEHQEFYAPWLVSRATYQDLNCIRIWRRR